MDLQPGGLLIWLIVGLIAGWAAGQFMKGSGFGLIGDIVVGRLRSSPIRLALSAYR